MESSTCTYVYVCSTCTCIGTYVHGHKCMHKHFVLTMSGILFPESSHEGSSCLTHFYPSKLHFCTDELEACLIFDAIRNTNLIIYFCQCWKILKKK